MLTNEERGLSQNPHTYKTMPTGDGALYKWVEFDENGDIVRESSQTWPSEADAEKAMRTIAPSTDIVEVLSLKNINADDNLNVNIVTKDTIVDDRFAGMTPVEKSVDDHSSDGNDQQVGLAAKATTARSPQGNVNLVKDKKAAEKAANQVEKDARAKAKADEVAAKKAEKEATKNK